MGRRGERVLSALAAVSRELGEVPTTVALAWVLLKPGIASAILRTGDARDVDLAMRATRVRLERNQVAQLDRASAP
jgi:aryl-alcohol dehydrogenase-like predicted oxidoreductase